MGTSIFKFIEWGFGDGSGAFQPTLFDFDLWVGGQHRIWYLRHIKQSCFGGLMLKQQNTQTCLTTLLYFVETAVPAAGHCARATVDTGTTLLESYWYMLSLRATSVISSAATSPVPSVSVVPTTIAATVAARAVSAVRPVW